MPETDAALLPIVLCLSHVCFLLALHPCTLHLMFYKSLLVMKHIGPPRYLTVFSLRPHRPNITRLISRHCTNMDPLSCSCFARVQSRWSDGSVDGQPCVEMAQCIKCKLNQNRDRHELSVHPHTIIILHNSFGNFSHLTVAPYISC